MKLVTRLLREARNSKLKLMILNLALTRLIPFNAPHGIQVLKVLDGEIQATLPYKPKNFNHLKGQHACALAALSEFSCGILLLAQFDSAKYRLIMKELGMTYHAQARSEVFAAALLPVGEALADFEKELNNHGEAMIELSVDTHDQKNKHISTARVLWQIKEWSRVRSKA